MKIAVLRERMQGELRVAATPETVGKMIAAGGTVTVEAGAGLGARILDVEFERAGATLAHGAVETVRGAEVILVVRRPEATALAGAAPGALLIGALDPYGNNAAIGALARAGVAAASMELMPRITRAQVMDILSSQANLAGYQAVIEAAAEFDRALPMMMTAAGTVRPAKAFVMGAGVAGLQAIATAKRLGAVVSATDVRPAAKEQVESLGGKFVAVEDEEFRQAETAAGYAKPMSEQYQLKQAELTASHIAKQDIVITTALIPGRPAPRLVSRAMVESMQPGSVIVDLAAERGGNVELTEPGRIVEHNGVKIIGHLNFAGRIPTTASQLYARNLLAFLETLIDKKERRLAINWEDDLVKATVLTRDGRVINPAFAEAEPRAPIAAPVAPVGEAPIAVPAMADSPAKPRTPRRVRSVPGEVDGTPRAKRISKADAAAKLSAHTGPDTTGALDGPVAFVPPEMKDAPAPAKRARRKAIPGEPS